MLDAFKIKSFDLKPVLEGWKDAPVFYGDARKDLPVEEWLDKIKEGCVKRGVPEEYWYKIAQHNMGPKAKARLDELKEVIRKVHGGKYRWTWKKFRIALMNMGWNIDKSETRTVKISGKSIGQWFTTKKDGAEAAVTEEPEPEAGKKDSSRGSVFWPHRKGSISETSQAETASNRSRRAPVRRATTDFFSTFNKESNQKEESSSSPPAPPPKSRSETTVAARSAPSSRSRTPPRSQTVSTVEEVSSPAINSNSSANGEVVNSTQAPVWLLNACNALDFITNEHPKTMSVLSAILITVGSIPAIPAVAAGAGGAVLASGAAHAIGAIAVGVGQALSMSVKNSQNGQQNQQNQITNTANGTHHQ